MKTLRCLTLILTTCCLSAVSLLADEIDFNFDWEFYEQKLADERLTDITDKQWQPIRLPHDWSIAKSFSKEHGDGATGYLPGGIGWYRKTFSTELLQGKKQAFLWFDGVYNNSEYWLNGKKLGSHPYGYAPFYFDISSLLNTDDQKNTLVVRVDRTRSVDSRWYTGSGIYRDVKLVTKNDLHIPVWGTFLTTEDVSDEAATVVLKSFVKNSGSEAAHFQLQTQIFDAQGNSVAEHQRDSYLKSGAEREFKQTLRVSQPQLWGIENPQLYRAVTTIRQDQNVTEKYDTPFGIRHFHFDANEGFFLNGKRTLIKGVCLHHDGGLVGAAVPLGVWERRLKTLRAAGCNAIRTAHNPFSAEFLDLCDRLGFLVQEEFFDEWEYPKDKRLNLKERAAEYLTEAYASHFGTWAERDLKATMLRDRNHPCIFMWSIGNEIEWCFPRYRASSGYFDPGKKIAYFFVPPQITTEEIRERFESSSEDRYVLAQTARRLANWTREMDTTRPVTANLILPSVSHESGYADALDVVGYSYRKPIYDYAHKRYPEKILYGSENVAQWHEWKQIIERPYLSGLFLWTGIDYIGESHDKWPIKANRSGIVDLAGFPKPSFHMMKSLWDETPHIYIATQRIEKSPYKLDEKSGEVVEKKANAWKRRLWFWHEVNEHWNYSPEEMICVELYSNCDEIELFLNEKSLGKKQLKDFPDHVYRWATPFQPGRLVARGLKAGKPTTAEVYTTSSPAAVQLTIDKTTLSADGYDVAHVVAQLVDENLRWVKSDQRKIYFEVEGDCRILGVDNGAYDSTQDYQTNEVVTDQGRCLLILQSTKPGRVSVTARTGKLKSETHTIQVQ